jgi:hypothetical protein
MLDCWPRAPTSHVLIRAGSLTLRSFPAVHGLCSRTDTVSTTTTPGTPSVHRGAILAVILVSYFMIVLDNSIVFTGLTRIREDLGFSTAGLSWVQNAYALVFGGLLLLGARAGDI